MIAAAAIYLRWELESALPGGLPFITMIPAVIVTSYIAGAGPGAVSAALCGVASWYWFVPPVKSWTLTPSAALALGLYAGVAAVSIWIIQRMHRARDRLQAESARAASLAEAQRTLFSELQHRVANNLAFVSAMLRAQRKQVSEAPETAPATLDEAIRRIELMGRIHRRLYRPEALEQPVGDYLRALCAELVDATGASGVECRVRADAVRLDLERLTALSLIVTELMTNSLKHAFRGRAGGAITIDLTREADKLALTVTDDGPGMPDAAAPSAAAARGLGLVILDSLARQLGAELHLPGPGQSATRLEFAA